MKRIVRHTYLWILFAAVTMVMAACSSDGPAVNIFQDPPRKPTAKSPCVTATQQQRARTVDWNDENAQDEEMMNIWVVVITNSSDEVEKVIACKPTSTWS